MPSDDKGFDGDAFYRALEGVVQSRGLTWKQVAHETKVGASTLARMARGSRPDASSLAALSAWSGVVPADFVSASFVPTRPETLTQITSLLRSDRNLDANSAEAIAAIVSTAYQNMKKG